MQPKWKKGIYINFFSIAFQVGSSSHEGEQVLNEYIFRSILLMNASVLVSL